MTWVIENVSLRVKLSLVPFFFFFSLSSMELEASITYSWHHGVQPNHMCRISVLGSIYWDIWDHDIKLYSSFLMLYMLEIHHNNKAGKMGLFYFKIGEKGERRWRERKKEEVRRKEGEAKRRGAKEKRRVRERTLNSFKDRNSLIWTARKPWL